MLVSTVDAYWCRVGLVRFVEAAARRGSTRRSCVTPLVADEKPLRGHGGGRRIEDVGGDAGDLVTACT
jgi:hypothetical protein